MKTFILIFVLTGYKWGGPATIEFNSLSECKEAGRTIQEHYGASVFKTPLCVEKTVPALSKEGGEE